jgi:hypothetical protein
MSDEDARDSVPDADSQTPDAVEPKEDDRWKCPICLGGLNEPVVTRCGHVFCWWCLREWLGRSNRCPTCGGIINRSGLISVTGQGPVADLSAPPQGVRGMRLRLDLAGLAVDVDLVTVLRPTGENICLWISIVFFIVVVCI